MDTHDDSSPAFPTLEQRENYKHNPEGDTYYVSEGGMSLRQYAAIKLRVPDSGLAWLDEMILASRRAEYAGLAMQGLLSRKGSGWGDPVAKEAAKEADLLIAGLKK
ncbi:MAG: hypothetical protein A3G73_02570 [Rhodospirillales bacterium RIFCSPLOWO2_12_FULL_67_15]|nr:MAG: hypothetical protein A3G73_02570 [Rhodospirillales bacterium RIFCSPLOWO2_12_FULL_67_15]